MLSARSRFRQWRRHGGTAYLVAGLVLAAAFVPCLLLVIVEAQATSRLIDEVDRGLRADAVTLAYYLERITMELLLEEGLAPVLLEQSPDASPSSHADSAPVPLPEAVEYLFTVDLDTRNVSSGREARFADEAEHVFSRQPLLSEALSATRSPARQDSEVRLPYQPATAKIRAGYADGRYGPFSFAYVLRCPSSQSECTYPTVLQGAKIKPDIVLARLLPRAYGRLVRALEERNSPTPFLNRFSPEDASPFLVGPLQSAMVSPEEGLTSPEQMVFEVETPFGLVPIGPRAMTASDPNGRAMSDPSATGTYTYPFTLGGLFLHWTLHVEYRNGLRESRPVRQVAILLALVTVLGGVVLAYWAVRRQFELSRTRSLFVSNVSHELKTPLATIKMYNELLATGDSGLADREQFHLYIDRMVMRLTTMVNNVLSLTKMELGRATYNMTEGDFGGLVRETVVSFRKLYAERGYHFGLAIEPDLPIIKGDPAFLGQVVINLLDNAVKYSNPHTIWVQVSLLRRGEQPYVTLTVRDQGVGIAGDKIYHIFEPFYRTEGGLAQRVSGSGLGLGVVKNVVEAHNGRVEVSSRKGEGTTFHILLPVERLRRRGEAPPVVIITNDEDRADAVLRAVSPLT